KTNILTIACAIVLSMGLGFGTTTAKAADQPAPAAAPAADAAATPPADASAAPAADASAAAPAATPTPDAAAVAAAENATKPVENPYGLGHLWLNGDWVAKTVFVLLAIMSGGTWYLFVLKFLDQNRIMGQAKVAERRFWSAANLQDGIDKLGKNSIFR